LFLLATGAAAAAAAAALLGCLGMALVFFSRLHNDNDQSMKKYLYPHKNAG